MKNILAIFKADVRGLVKNVLALIIIIGLCILPSLYAWFNIYSNWDPYANTGNIKIAAYSEDEGYTGEDGTVQNMGGKILDNLKENTAIGWTMVNSGEEAIEGVKSGDYYAAVVIEKDFSYKMFNMFAEGFANPGITYYENEKKNAVATKLTDTAVSTLQQSIDAQFVDVVIRTVFEQTNNVSGEIETNNKIKEFTDKLTAVNNNLIIYETTIESLISANKELTTSVGKAQDEIDSLKGQVDTGIDDVTGVQNGISTTRTSLYCAASFVFILIVIESCDRCDLYYRKCFSLNNSDREFSSLYILFDNEFVFPLKCIVKCSLEFVCISYYGNTYT